MRLLTGLAVPLWLTVSIGAQAQTQRIYFEAEGEHPPALMIRLSQKDSTEIQKLFAPEKVSVAVAEVRNGKSGYMVPSSSETLKEILDKVDPARTLDESYLLVSDNWSGLPYLGIRCADKHCAVWMWIWPDKKDSPWAQLISIQDGIPGAGKFIQLDLMDPADASQLFERMQTGTDRKQMERGERKETLDYKSFVSDDGDFTFDCASRVPPERGYFCSAQASLTNVSQVDKSMPAYTLSQRALASQIEAVDARAVAKAEVLKGHQQHIAQVRAQIAALNAAVNAANGGSSTPYTDMFIRAYYSSSRGLSIGRNATGPGGSAFFHAIGEDVLKQLYLDARRFIPPTPRH